MKPSSHGLPAVFKSAHKPAVVELGYVTGTIIACNEITYPVSRAEKMSFSLATVTLDEPHKGTTEAFARILPTNRGYDLPGHRLRGKLFLSDEQKDEILLNGITGFDFTHRYMKNFPATYFDFRTLHMAADDQRTMATGDPYRTCLDIVGRWGGHNSYYDGHGYNIEKMEKDRLERASCNKPSALQRFLNLF